MVFLGGAVLANLVRHISAFHFNLQHHTNISLDCRQGRHVGIQAGVAGTGCACSGEAWSAIKWLYLGGFYGVLSLISRLVLLRTLPHYLQAVFPCFFHVIFSVPHDPPCRYPSLYFPYLAASSILCLDWSGAGGLGAVDIKERNISIDMNVFCLCIEYMVVFLVGIVC